MAKLPSGAWWTFNNINGAPGTRTARGTATVTSTSETLTLTTGTDLVPGGAGDDIIASRRLVALL